MTQFARNFWPLFLTQFFGAFNDHVLKNALILLVAFQTWTLGGFEPAAVVAMAAGIFILPFFFFSGLAGQLSDRFCKARLMRYVKGAEVGIMLAAGIGFYTSNLPLLFMVLFAMGTQSALFGPAKYSILPELLGKRALVRGNGIVEAGTFLAILLGTILGGVLAVWGGPGHLVLCAVLLAVAVAGWIASLFIPARAASAPQLRVYPDPVRPMVEAVRETTKSRPVFLTILGISWFWFLGVSFLTVLPTYVREVLGGSELAVTVFLALFCVGIAAGSLLCSRISGPRLELGLIPFGAIGMSVFTIDLFLVGAPRGNGAELLSVGELLAMPAIWRVALDLGLLALFSGFYAVPLNTQLQQQAANAARSRVIAGNNVMNALFMVASSLALMGWYALGLTIPQMFLLLGSMNAAVAVFIYTVIPESMLRLVVTIIARILYRTKVVNRRRLPLEGPAILACNHQSFVDFLFVASASKVPVRFVMYHSFSTMPLLRFLFRDAGVIPIAAAHENRKTLIRAFDEIAAALERGEIVCIFPEGKLTRHGGLHPFRTGIERIVKRTPVPVIPLALEGMWGSFFSHKDGQLFKRPFRRIWPRVTLTVGEAIPPEQLSAERLAWEVARLGNFAPPAASEPSPTRV